MTKVIKIEKVRLVDFIEALKGIYDDGVDYVDIVGKVNAHQDIIEVEVRDEYMRNTTKLTDELLNDLI